MRILQLVDREHYDDEDIFEGIMGLRHRSQQAEWIEEVFEPASLKKPRGDWRQADADLGFRRNSARSLASHGLKL